MNALLDYGSSSSGDSDDSQDEKTETKPKLPKPAILGESALQTSVFSNPFVEAELAKAAILEKHVKMVPGKDDTQMINGKKICWNYRKGKCRFGHNCKYAHDSDIHKLNETKKQKTKAAGSEWSGTMTSGTPLEHKLPTDDEIWEGGPEKKRKRPGLSKGLVPGRKVLQMYKEQKNKEANKHQL